MVHLHGTRRGADNGNLAVDLVASRYYNDASVSMHRFECPVAPFYLVGFAYRGE